MTEPGALRATDRRRRDLKQEQFPDLAGQVDDLAVVVDQTVGRLLAGIPLRPRPGHDRDIRRQFPRGLAQATHADLADRDRGGAPHLELLVLAVDLERDPHRIHELGIRRGEIGAASSNSTALLP